MSEIKSDKEYASKIYQELCQQFVEDFLGETSINKDCTAKDIKDLPREEVDAIQKEWDKEDCRDIYNAFLNGKINQEETRFLLSYYRDSMSVYRGVYRSLYELFGNPEQIACMDPVTGVLETHIQKAPHIDAKKQKVTIIRENVVTNYSLKEVTPFTCMRLEYRDNENNPVYIILPKMKRAKRAIEKIQDYHFDYMKQIKAVNDAYHKHQNSEQYKAELNAIKKPVECLGDILRLTVSRKYYSGVIKTHNDFVKNAVLGVNPAESRSSFYENDMKNYEQLKKNSKNYYDIKDYFNLTCNTCADAKKIKVEVQIKITAFYRSDLQTHLLYEEQRAIEEQLKRKRDEMRTEEIQRAEYRIMLLKKEIQKTNKDGNHEYNMQVLDKVRWLEDGYRALRIPPDYPDNTYKVCHDLIKKDYMVRPHKVFDDDKEFDPKDKDNILISSRGGFNLNIMHDISRRYKEDIANKYCPLRHDHTYSNVIPGGHYNPKTDWDTYGKARKFRADMNKNIYKDNYDQDYWKTYDQAENQVETEQKTLTANEIRMYHENMNRKKAR